MEPSARKLALLLLPVFSLAGLALYWPSFSGGFYSDDFRYVYHNDYVHALTVYNLREILHPYGAVSMLVQNYAPVHLIAHAVEWRIFGPSPLGFHVVNVLVHVLGSSLFVALLRRSGASPLAAALAGTAFLVHPANVETVAWISQLKTTGALVFALAALLLRRRQPALATLCFTLALLTKALAAFALPVALLFEWIGHRDTDAPSRRRAWVWLAVWSAIFVGFAVLEFPLFRITNLNAPPLAPDLDGQLRGVVTIGGRYLVVAATSWGVGVFQEAWPSNSWLDPRWLASLLVICAIAARAIHALRRRSVESVYWGWAAISFVPVSQIFPFLYPFGDRYLYFVLPGLLGGVLFMGSALLEHVAETRRAQVRRSIALVACLWLTAFTIHSAQRTWLWRDTRLVEAETVARYPDGLLAAIHDVQLAATRGDADAAVAAIRRGLLRGNQHLWSLRDDPIYAPVREDPRFQELLRDMARYWVSVEPYYTHPSQIDLRAFADAYMLLGDLEAAKERLERALEVGGVRDAQVQQQLIRIRIDLARLRKGAPPPADSNEGS